MRKKTALEKKMEKMGVGDVEIVKTAAERMDAHNQAKSFGYLIRTRAHYEGIKSKGFEIERLK
jgi:hypothetical protein